jgi:hypothetical protein
MRARRQLASAPSALSPTPLRFCTGRPLPQALQNGLRYRGPFRAGQQICGKYNDQCCHVTLRRSHGCLSRSLVPTPPRGAHFILVWQ